MTYKYNYQTIEYGKTITYNDISKIIAQASFLFQSEVQHYDKM